MDFAVTLGSSLKRKRVLCAEDQILMATLIRRVLERSGHEVVCVGDGREAWDRVEINPAGFDAVVTDHQMPVMNGLELVCRLRGIRFAGKIIVQSTHLSLAEERAYRALKVDAILHKPAGLFELPNIL
jgi:CheY-like chemotaxis protein